MMTRTLIYTLWIFVISCASSVNEVDSKNENFSMLKTENARSNLTFISDTSYLKDEILECINKISISGSKIHLGSVYELYEISLDSLKLIVKENLEGLNDSCYKVKSTLDEFAKTFKGKIIDASNLEESIFVINVLEMKNPLFMENVVLLENSVDGICLTAYISDTLPLYRKIIGGNISNGIISKN